MKSIEVLSYFFLFWKTFFKVIINSVNLLLHVMTSQYSWCFPSCIMTMHLTFLNYTNLIDLDRTRMLSFIVTFIHLADLFASKSVFLNYKGN